jgi:hypothetical protein
MNNFEAMSALLVVGVGEIGRGTRGDVALAWFAGSGDVGLDPISIDLRMEMGFFVGGGNRGVGFLMVKCGFADTDWSKSFGNKV